LFHHIAGRSGRKKANSAVAHRILTLAYCIIRDGSRYREIGFVACLIEAAAKEIGD
jgi:hypothetical protein